MRTQDHFKLIILRLRRHFNLDFSPLFTATRSVPALNLLRWSPCRRSWSPYSGAEINPPKAQFSVISACFSHNLLIVWWGCGGTSCKATTTTKRWSGQQPRAARKNAFVRLVLIWVNNRVRTFRISPGGKQDRRLSSRAHPSRHGKAHVN